MDNDLLNGADRVGQASGAAPRAPARQGFWRRTVSGPLGPFVGVGLLLVVLILFQLMTSTAFATPNNLTGLARASAIPILLGAAMTLVLLTGGVDLSIGSTLALCGVAYAKLVTGGVEPALALACTLALGGFIGFAINGMLIGIVKMSFFVVTLGTLSLYRGLVYLWTDSRTINMYEDRLSSALGDAAVFGGRVPVSILLVFGIVLVLYATLNLSTFGRRIYAVGGNREAADLSGVRSGWVIASVYGINGLCAALAGVMTVGRTTIADPNMGSGAELQAAAAALLGGLALSGGIGSIWGAVLGVVFLQVLSNALALAGASAAWQLVVTGGILVIAVYLDQVRSKIARTDA